MGIADQGEKLERKGSENGREQMDGGEVKKKKKSREENAHSFI